MIYNQNQKLMKVIHSLQKYVDAAQENKKEK